MSGSICHWVYCLLFALGRRTPSKAPLWAVDGPAEDALSHHGHRRKRGGKNVVGFVAASVGVRIDWKKPTIRLILNFLLSLLSSAIFVFTYRVLLGLDLEWRWFTDCCARLATR